MFEIIFLVTARLVFAAENIPSVLQKAAHTELLYL